MSPLGRVRRTVEIIRRSLDAILAEVRIDERLKEISWGRLEGMTRDEIKGNAPEFWRQRKADRWSVAPPGGESFADLSARLEPVLDDLVSLEQPAVVVAHGGVRRLLRGLYGRLRPAEIVALKEPHDIIVRLENGTTTTFVANYEELP